MISAVEGGTTDKEANDRGASAADAALVILRRDQGDGPHFVITSVDGAGQPLGVEELFRLWVSLASSILHADDPRLEVAARRRFCKWTLERLALDENLQRFTKIKAENPELTEQEAVQRMRVDSGIAPST